MVPTHYDQIVDVETLYPNYIHTTLSTFNCNLEKEKPQNLIPYTQYFNQFDYSLYYCDADGQLIKICDTIKDNYNTLKDLLKTAFVIIGNKQPEDLNLEHYKQLKNLFEEIEHINNIHKQYPNYSPSNEYIQLKQYMSECEELFKTIDDAQISNILNNFLK